MTREEFADSVGDYVSESNRCGEGWHIESILDLLDEYEASQWKRPEEWSGEGRYGLFLGSRSGGIPTTCFLSPDLMTRTNSAQRWRELPPGPKEGE
jgi:hypothetical protein